MPHTQPAAAEIVPSWGLKPARSKIRYFGYRRVGGPDVVYLYVQGLRIDLRIPRKREDELQRLGFAVRYSDGFQGRAVWLTGWRVLHDTRKTGVVFKWILKAFLPGAMQ